MSAKASEVGKGGKGGKGAEDVKQEVTSVSTPAMGAVSPGSMQSASDTSAEDSATGELVQAERRITPKTVMEGNITDMILEGLIKLPCSLYSVIGRANNLRDGESDHGPWTAAIGEFEATRISDGKIFIGKECHVPGAAGELLITELRRFVIEQESDTAENIAKRGRRYKTSGDVVDVGIIVGIKKSTRQGGAPYEFTVTSIVPVRRSDALAALRQKAMAQIAALPAAMRPATPAQAALPAPDAKP